MARRGHAGEWCDSRQLHHPDLAACTLRRGERPSSARVLTSQLATRRAHAAHPSLRAAIGAMELWRLVILEVHTDHDAEESPDLRIAPAQVGVASHLARSHRRQVINLHATGCMTARGMILPGHGRDGEGRARAHCQVPSPSPNVMGRMVPGFRGRIPKSSAAVPRRTGRSAAVAAHSQPGRTSMAADLR
jgi:hypothetical protein